MRNQISLGRYFGIEVGLHLSWFIIAFLITLSIAGHFHMTNPQWSGTVMWGASIVTVVLFFVTLLMHEMSHALVAKYHGIPVKAITLFALGGVAQIEKEAGDARTEFWLGIVGPLTSLVIGFACLGSARALGWVPELSPSVPWLAVLVWLGYINFTLAVFNLIPGFPLDGGRVLRALVWWATGNGQRATRIAAEVGRLVAFTFIFIGVLQFFRGAGFSGLWLAFIGWFLKDAAAASATQLDWATALKGVRVVDVMSRDCVSVPGSTDLEAFVHQYLLRTGRRCYVVEEGGVNAGLLTLHEVKQIDPSRWRETRVRQVMIPLRNLHSVRSETPLEEALAVMGQEDVNQLPVVSDGHIEGLISRGGILRLLKTYAEVENP